MSFYSMGANAMGADAERYRRRAVYGSEVGAVVTMPGAIRDEILTVEIGFKDLDKAIRAAQSKGEVNQEFASGWTLFYAEWQNFRSSHNRWIDNMWRASYDKTLEYRERLDEWRKKLEQATGRPIGRPTIGPTAGPSEAPGIPWRTLAIVGAIAGGLWALSRTFSAAAELKREFPHHAAVSE